ncbi:serine hydrolase [Paenibacillus sp. S150]|uniref:serine hydrolase domain-containing protein n=1 Tax=Paenibacillus sp. S150 TaxID=2749826 RepID=UPI001C5A0571|nr:serine hydrolase [Paenibacillus sp. S150]MBW4083035.1 serine hydrolase [Paenibacillus sp. S150]
MKPTSLTAAVAPLNLRSCLISLRGGLRFEHYRDGRTASEMAKINSCTKSVLSSLICIAMDKGLLPGPAAGAAGFFPQLRRDMDKRKQEITLEQLLTLSAGFRWTEFGGLNSFPKMTRSPNWVEYVLEQPLADDPGTRMEYNSGVSQLLSAILVQASGMTTARFAEQYLFGPLGITEYQWEADPQGIHTGGFGLKLRPADLLKFGQLYLQQGNWEKTQIISRRRVACSVQPALAAEPPRHGGYGWHWWTDSIPLRSTNGEPAAMDYYYARGYAGQFVYVLPEAQSVVVLTRDSKRGKNNPPPDVFREHIAPLLVSPDGL